ncbi:MAG: hypothetical protein RMJ67_01220 [Elusimicrobiota bacterium]|nr:hypothetical protein [Endomicrobiia bacterium]MDW8165124.1 hypothetical protein [Elusimicrobiota bacterium]
MLNSISSYVRKFYYITLNKDRPFLVIKQGANLINEIYYFLNDQWHPIGISRTAKGVQYLDLEQLSKKYDNENLTLNIRMEKNADIVFEQVSKKELEEYKKDLFNFFGFFENLGDIARNAFILFLIGVLVLLVLIFIFSYFIRLTTKTLDKAFGISQLPALKEEEIPIPIERIKDLTKNYLVEKLKDYDKNDVIEYRMKEVYNKDGVRHLVRLAYLKSEKSFVAVSLLHPYECEKVRKTIEYYGIKRILKHVSMLREKKDALKFTYYGTI